MTDAHTSTSSAQITDQTLTEQSPPAGRRELSEELEADDIGEPVDAIACGALGCHNGEDLRRVTDDGRSRVLCPDHLGDFLHRHSEVNA